MHAALDAQGVVWWPSGSVPRAFVEEYTKLTAAMAGSSFGKAIDPAMVALLEARVRKGAMVLSADTNAQQAVQAIHDDLVMRGLARWTSLDIPNPVGEAMEVLAADRLAPLFGGDTDPRDTQAAMIAIYRYVALPSIRRDRVDRLLLNPTRFVMAYKLHYSDYPGSQGRLIRLRGSDRLDPKASPVRLDPKAFQASRRRAAHSCRCLLLLLVGARQPTECVARLMPASPDCWKQHRSSRN